MLCLPPVKTCLDMETILLYKRFASRTVPPATLHHEEEWDGTDGPNN